MLRPLCDALRRTQVGSVADLPEHRFGGDVGDLTRSLVAHCRRGLSSPETEQAQNDWDLRVFGTKTPSPDGSYPGEGGAAPVRCWGRSEEIRVVAPELGLPLVAL